MRRKSGQFTKRDDSDLIGRVFKSTSCGPFKVIERSGSTNNGTALYLVEFSLTKFQTKSRRRRIKRGVVRDPYYPSVYGVGYMGEVDRCAKDYAKDCARWRQMISRCYNSYDDKYHRYGARGIEVCKRWHCFSNYLHDIELLKNHKSGDHDSIDRVDNDGNYSPQNCRWATPRQQARNKGRVATNRDFIAVSPDGQVHQHYDQRYFARQHDLNRVCICHCLNGRSHTHKGWTFEYVDVTGGGER